LTADIGQGSFRNFDLIERCLPGLDYAIIPHYDLFTTYEKGGIASPIPNVVRRLRDKRYFQEVRNYKKFFKFMIQQITIDLTYTGRSLPSSMPVHMYSLVARVHKF
jgi:hypothetical protein